MSIFQIEKLTPVRHLSALQRRESMKTSIVYEGPSMLDGSPIVALVSRKGNRKLGEMSQLWIMRSDVSPEIAIKTGEDSSICGKCPHRGRSEGERSCYVFVGQGPRMLWRKYKRGLCSPMDDRPFDGLRLGAYGDPAALPVSLIRDLEIISVFTLGYTHQWATCDQGLRQYLMASVESPAEAARAQAMGWRTFRVKLPTVPLEAGEVQCPYQTHGRNCEDCQLCSGNGKRVKSIAINAHGFNYKLARFRQNFAALAGGAR
jgi:hypothetical protein